MRQKCKAKSKAGNESESYLLIYLSQLEKNKFHIQQLEGDVVKCREQVARSEEESRAAQREIKRLQVASNDQRDALANEVSLKMTTSESSSG